MPNLVVIVDKFVFYKTMDKVKMGFHELAKR